MSTKKFLSIILCLCMLVGLCQFTLPVSATGTDADETADEASIQNEVADLSAATTLSINKTQFVVGEEIVFEYQNSASAKDWIAVYDTEDYFDTSTNKYKANYIDYVYTQDTNGTVSFSPEKGDTWTTVPGTYHLRYLYGDMYVTLLASYDITIYATEAEIPEIPTEYYIKKGGTGDGTSSNTPAGSVINIVNKINSDGHTTGDLVTVYVIDNGEGSKKAITSDCVLGYGNNGTDQVPEHKATIKWTSYDPDTVTSLIGHVNWQGADSNAAHWTVSGPSIFEDINIIDMRTSKNGGTDIYLNHWPVEFHNVKFGDLSGTNQTATYPTVGTIFYPSSTHFSLGMIRGKKTVERDQYIYLDNASIIGEYLEVFGYTEADTAQGIKGDVTLDIASGTVKNLRLSGSAGTETVDGNLSIILGEGVTVSKFTTSSIPVVTGAFSIIQNYGATIPEYTNTPWATSAKEERAPYYNLVAGSNAVEINVTDTAGTFEVDGTGIVYAYTSDKKTVYYSETSSLSLPEGTYTVNAAADLDAVKAAVNPPEEDVLGNPFYGWDETTAGKLVAQYGDEGETPSVFYAQYGASGTGGSEDSPAGSIAGIVATINELYPDGGDVTVYIIPHEDEPTDGKFDSAEDEVFLEYQSVPNHKANITYKSYGTGISTLTFKNKWNSSASNGHMHIMGPSVFDGIRIVDTRTDGSTADFYCNDYNVEFKNVEFKVCRKQDEYAYSNWSGNGHFHVGGIRNNYTLSGDSAVVKLDTIICNDFNMSGYADKSGTNNVKHTEDLTAILGTGTLKYLYIDGAAAGYPASFAKNVNIILNGTQVTNFNNNNTPDIKGALQVIRNNGASLAAMPEYGFDVYDLTADTGVTLGLTDTAGTFSVEYAGEGVAYAVSKDGRTIYYGAETITLAPGAYTVKVAASVDAIIADAEEPLYTAAYRFDGWDRSVDGVITAILTYVGSGEAAYFVMNGGTGNGLSPSAPIASVAEAITAINTAGYVAGDDVTIYIMDACDKPYHYDQNGNSVVGKDIKTNTTKTKTTTWMDANANNPPVWTANLTIDAYDYETTSERTHLMWHPEYGRNTQLIVNGPITFKNINLINPRKFDREYFINGYDATFENCVFYHLNAEAHSGNGIYDGAILEGHANFMLSNASTTAGGAGSNLVIDSAFTATGNPYGVWIAGTQDDSYSEHVTVNLANENIVTDIYWGSKTATFENGLSIVNNGTINSYVDKYGNVVIKNGFELISMFGNPCFDLELPTSVTVTGGIWNIKVDSDAMFIEPSGTVGTYIIHDENLVAVAGNEDTGATYVSKDGVLTLPAGTYTVSSLPASEIDGLEVEVYFDDELADGTYLKGHSIYLPILENTLFDNFDGWFSVYDVEDLNGGILYNIPEDCDEALYFYSVWSPIPDTTLVFVDAVNGLDSNGGTQAAPVQTLAKAFELALATTNSIKKVVVVGEIEVSGEMPKNTSPIIITGDGTDNSVFDLYNDCIYAQGEITFENISFTHTTSGGGKVFCTSIYPVTFGENVTIGNKFSVRVGGYDNYNGPVKATFKSGNFGTVEVGHFWATNRSTATTANIIVDGANISTINFTSNSWAENQKGCNYPGAVKVIVNSGSVGSINATSTADSDRLYAEFQDTVTILFNNGETASVEADVAGAKGTWIISSAKVEGCMLETTGTAGTFEVVGGKTALATSDTGAQYVSSEGTLVLPQGTYSVDYVDEIFYINNGTEITVYNDCTIDLSTIAHTEIDGKLFIGWSDKNGNACELNGSYVEGDILTAQYIDYTAANDFFIKGAQIRTTGTQGLRFIVEKKNSFFDALPEVSEFGTIVLPTVATWGRDISLEKNASGEYVGAKQVAEWTWDAETKLIFTPKTYNGYAPSKVLGEKIYYKTNDAVQYTLCITGVSEDKYYRYYTVKGYIVYSDLNGVENVLYTDYYQTNIYEVALEALKANEAPAETFEGIKEYVEVDRKAAYMAENYDNRTLLSGYPTTEDTDPNHAMYQLANGFKVREVEIDSGTGGDAVEIVHFADTHLNYINQKDMDLGDVNTLSTYRGRSWLRSGSSVPTIARAMEYASFFDKAIITGDVMDYFSWGCAEIMTKMIVDQNKGKMLMAMGNHEPAERMQADMSGLSDKYTLAERYAVLQEMWTNDIYYHSEIIKNDEGTEKVMVVVLDNQRDKYWGDIQSVPFAADIATAREKGIPILIFEHDPICTNNPNETAVDYFYESGDTSGMPCDMTKRFAGSPSLRDEDTMKVYNLIVQNPDVIKGIFCGHWHNHMYTEVLAQNANGSFMTDNDGNYVVIPQYIVTANAYNEGNAIKITVK